ncbi:ArsR/SmtB family transcription factor [Marinivivus vitaminiproducens]|uniref:ArsR/SmtB family transcription factor n=1 Tax=Marinivivus vitaminiproducens TaxID=3035935 RepID=UPI00279FBC3F|nr:helix-turn-helix domain-containing protein [Geminicoccaceae bacterium SCSIO 64248]
MSVVQKRSFLAVTLEDETVLRGLASPVRIRILGLLRRHGRLNVNEISAALGLPQSTVATNVQILEQAELIETRLVKASKGQQKVCALRYEEIVIRLNPPEPASEEKVIEVSMPLGLYTSCAVSAPCGLCSVDGVIGLLDVPDLFMDPGRMQAALAWFWRGSLEYKFPNNARILQSPIRRVEFIMELSSEVPGTNTNWPSDISIWLNGTKIGTWTAPGDYGDRRGRFTPHWWKLAGSQYGVRTVWAVTGEGTFVNDARISDVTLAELGLAEHHSIRLRIGIEDDARHPGGINIFGKGFGNHGQDIMMRILL